MTWLWSQWQDFALGCAGLFGLYIIVQIIDWARRDWHSLARVLCGELALVFALLVLLWGIAALPN